MEMFIVLLLSVGFAFLNLLHVFYFWVKTPTGTIFIGITHWYEDYYYYLSQMVQGARGAWTLINAYTTETIPMGLNWWFNLLLGKLMYVIPLQPWTIYDATVFILSICYILALYKVAARLFPKESDKRLATLVVALTATSLFVLTKTAQGISLTPYTFFYPYTFAFNRLGGVAHLIFQNIISLLLLLAFARILSLVSTMERRIKWAKVVTQAGICALLLVPLFIVSPFYVAIDVVVLSLVSLGYLLVWRKISRLLLLAVSFIIVFLPLVPLALAQAQTLAHPFFQYMRDWEVTRYPTTFANFVLSTGILAFLFPFGIIPYLKKASPLRVLGLVYAFVPIVFYFSPLPPLLRIPFFRILQPPAYVFLAAVGVEALGALSNFLAPVKRPNWRLILFVLLLLIFVSIQLPVLVTELRDRREYYLNSQLNYMDRGIYDGLVFLRRQPHDKIAMAIHTLETFVPVVSGFTVYSGHTTLTYHYDEKINQVLKFYELRLTPDEAYVFLKNNRIGYVLWRTADGNPAQFSYYPFLTTIYQNPKIIIYAVR